MSVDRIYAVSARVGERTAEGEIWRDVPTFYLFANVQGIVSEDHAGRVARSVIGDPELCSVCVVETSAGGSGTAHPLGDPVDTLASTVRWIAERDGDTAELRAARAAMAWLDGRDD